MFPLINRRVLFAILLFHLFLSVAWHHRPDLRVNWTTVRILQLILKEDRCASYPDYIVGNLCLAETSVSSLTKLIGEFGDDQNATAFHFRSVIDLYSWPYQVDREPSILENAVGSSPRGVTLVNRSLLRAFSGDTLSAAGILKDRDSEGQVALLSLARMLAKRDSWKRTLDILEVHVALSSIAQHAVSPDGQFLMGRALLAQDRGLAARLSFQTALASGLSSSDQIADAHYYLGTIAWQYSGDLTVAESEFRQVIAEAPQHFWAHLRLGILLRETRRFDESLDQFATASRLVPSNEHPLVEAAATFYVLRNYDKAFFYLDQAQKLNESNYSIWYWRGKIRLALSDYQTSVEMLETAVRKGGDTFAVLQALGDAYTGIGLTEKAAKAYERAQNLQARK